MRCDVSNRSPARHQPFIGSVRDDPTHLLLGFGWYGPLGRATPPPQLTFLVKEADPDRPIDGSRGLLASGLRRRHFSFAGEWSSSKLAGGDRLI